MDVRIKGCMTRLAQVVLLSIASYANAQPLEYLSVDEISKEMQRGQLSAEALVQHLQQRIDRLDKNGPTINSIIELNPDALAIARSLDRERERGHVRGPMHGIPLLLKDNIDTSDQMQTSAALPH